MLKRKSLLAGELPAVFGSGYTKYTAADIAVLDGDETKRDRFCEIYQHVLIPRYQAFAEIFMLNKHLANLQHALADHPMLVPFDIKSLNGILGIVGVYFDMVVRLLYFWCQASLPGYHICTR